MRRLQRLLLVLAVPAVLAPVPGAHGAPDRGPDPTGRWPLSPVPEVVTDFAPPGSPWGAGHRGVDLLGDPGQRVRAALPGTVSFVGTIAGRGVVTVSHGDTRTTYEPVSSTLSRGTAVGAGEVLGRLALPGSHCLPRACLHWGWLRGTTYLDPLDLVGGGPVRLLPLGGLPGTSGSLGVRGSPYARWVPLTDRVWPAAWP